MNPIPEVKESEEQRQKTVYAASRSEYGVNRGGV